MEKFILKSKTFQGLILMGLVNVLPLIGITFGPDDSALFTSLTDSIIQSLSFVWAAYGRWVAKTSITITP